ncbi:neuronal acetylcholine receptor subunit alpha-7-like [Argopecten irradians]|uniref:neuronal acetylcholine receptor subunit alpha-7-like n=1 Tax=Argopecten irradians TaxID=31199 RepID=UPI0037133C1A
MTSVRVISAIFILAYVITSCVHAQSTMDDLMRLKDNLFQNYTKDFRPVYDLSTTFLVTLDMFLVTILDVDEVTGTMSVNCGLSLSWFDYRLAWNTSDYNYIKSFVFNSSNVWKPRLYITTAADDMSDFSYDAVDVRVYSNGIVASSPVRNVRTTCSFDMTKFPTDSQTCVMQLASWMYLASELTLLMARPDINLAYYTPNGEWSISGTSVTNNTDLGSMFSVLDFTIHLTRRSAYFIISMTAPVLILCFLTPFVFLLPASSGERISYTITMFLSLAVYMTIIGDKMPNISDPMAGISILLLVAMIYSCLLILLTIFTLRCEAESDVHEFPRWLLWLASRLCKNKTTSSANKVDASLNVHDEKFNKEADVIATQAIQKPKKISLMKKDVMSFIDKGLFYLTLSVNIITCSVFAFCYWI